MQNYVKKPDAVTAIKFEGGEENAKTIVDWITGLDLRAEYHPNGGQYNAAGEESSNEQIWLFNFWGAMGVDVGEWVVYDAEAVAASPMTDSQFSRQYELKK